MSDLNEDQARAVELATTGKRIGILTGAPGTGKTFTVKAIVNRLSDSGRRVRLAAPTGKAARRMSEQTGRMATTIHRLLEPRPMKGEDGKVRFTFSRDDRNPIDADAFVFDETSMLEVPLAWKLWRAIPRHARVLMVGDTNQLSPVGPGALLLDLINSGVVPSVQLNKIMRQDGGGRLVRACHAIKDGRLPEIPNGPDDDLRMIESSDDAEILATIVDLVDGGIAQNPKFSGINPLKDIQVLSPTRDKGPLSCLALNIALQGRLNRAGDEGDEPGKLRVGDKVVQTRNDYERGIVNGDIGFIKNLFKDRNNREQFLVEFEDVTGQPFNVELPRWENNLELAYCLTVHRYQGSEAPIVIIPIHSSQPPILMQRNWVYTAISRARNLCVLVGERGIIGKAIGRVNSQKRCTHLAEMLRGHSGA